MDAYTIWQQLYRRGGTSVHMDDVDDDLEGPYPQKTAAAPNAVRAPKTSSNVSL